MLTAQHVSGVFSPIIRSSMIAVAAFDFTFVSWWQSCCVRGRAGGPAVIELLMMGGKTPETCWAVNKRQDNKLENCCIWLVIYLNCHISCYIMKTIYISVVLWSTFIQLGWALPPLFFVFYFLTMWEMEKGLQTTNAVWTTRGRNAGKCVVMLCWMWY
jgi:hypothetical protein